MAMICSACSADSSVSSRMPSATTLPLRRASSRSFRLEREGSSRSFSTWCCRGRVGGWVGGGVGVTDACATHARTHARTRHTCTHAPHTRAAAPSLPPSLPTRLVVNLHHRQAQQVLLVGRARNVAKHLGDGVRHNARHVLVPHHRVGLARRRHAVCTHGVRACVPVLVCSPKSPRTHPCTRPPNHSPTRHIKQASRPPRALTGKDGAVDAVHGRSDDGRGDGAVHSGVGGGAGEDMVVHKLCVVCVCASGCGGSQREAADPPAAHNARAARAPPRPHLGAHALPRVVLDPHRVAAALPHLAVAAPVLLAATEGRGAVSLLLLLPPLAPARRPIPPTALLLGRHARPRAPCASVGLPPPAQPPLRRRSTPPHGTRRRRRTSVA